MTVEIAALHRWLAAAAVATMAACAAPPPRSLAERADGLMQDLADRRLFQGAVVVGRAGRIEYTAGFGFADIGQHRPFTPDTPTDGASIAKTFTAAALLQLSNEGRLDLETPVRAVLPAYPHAGTRVRHLLAHSAGLPGYGWLDTRVTPGEPRTNAGHLALIARDAPAPAFAPGSAFAYDNVAYDVAAMVLERVTGSSYASVVAQRMAGPLGLAAFVRPARLADWPGLRTRGYRRAATGWQDHDALDLEGFHGGGNIYLSARDLYRWAAGYRDLVGPDVLRAAISPARLDDGRRTGLSLGSWYVSSDGQRRHYTGHHNGFHNFAYADDARGLAIAWVANDAPPWWLQSALGRALIAVAEGREPERLVPPGAVQVVADPSGTYRVGGVGEVTVRQSGRQLRVQLNAVDYDGFPEASGVHYVPGLDAYLHFAAADDGRVLLYWDSVAIVVPAVPREGPGGPIGR